LPVTRTPPSGTEARRLQDELQKTWQPAFDRDTRLRDLVNRKNKVELLPETVDLNVEPVELHTGRAGSLLDHAQTFVGALPSLAIEPVDLTTEARRVSEQDNAGRGGLLTGRTVLTALPTPAVWTTVAGFPVRQKGERAKAYIDRVNTWKKTKGEVPLVLQSIPSDKILLKLDSNDKALAALETKVLTAQI
jgi:hypothetical protein